MAGANYDGPVTKVELYISCTDLVNKDVFSKSDPFAVLFETKPGLGQKGWMVDKTEVIYDNLNPKVSVSIYAMQLAWSCGVYDVKHRLCTLIVWGFTFVHHPYVNGTGNSKP